MNRIIAITLSVLLLAGFGIVAWTVVGLPPVRMVWQHGLSRGSEPTGRKIVVKGAEFIEIGPGCFRMGSNQGARGGDFLGRWCSRLALPWGDRPKPSDEVSVHWVEVPRGFCPPSVLRTWSPSSAGDDERRLGEYAWHDANSKGKAHKVGTRRANAWGLHDLHGNVWEWCEDTYHENYEGAPADGTAWTEGGELWQGTPFRVIRGGSFYYRAVYCRSAKRGWIRPGFRRWDLGFRPAFSLTEP